MYFYSDYRELKNLSISTEHPGTSLYFTRAKIDLTRNPKFKMPINLLESKLLF